MSRPPPTTIRTIAPSRSDQGARLKNSHQTTITSPKTAAPMMPAAAHSGTNGGDDQPAEPLQRNGDDAGPEAERFAGNAWGAAAINCHVTLLELRARVAASVCPGIAVDTLRL